MLRPVCIVCIMSVTRLKKFAPFCLSVATMDSWRITRHVSWGECVFPFIQSIALKNMNGSTPRNCFFFLIHPVVVYHIKS